MKQYFKRVEAWLYSIPHKQAAVVNLRKQLEQLGRQLDDMPPISVTQPDRVRVAGGEHVSTQDRWLLKRETIENQREWINFLLLEKQAELDLFTSQLERLRQEDSLAMERIAEHYFVVGHIFMRYANRRLNISSMLCPGCL